MDIVDNDTEEERYVMYTGQITLRVCVFVIVCVFILEGGGWVG